MARERKGRGGWWFLATAVLIFALAAAVDPERAQAALALTGRLLLHLLPVLALVFVLTFLLDLLLDRARVARWLGHGSGRRGWWLALLAGVLSMGPAPAWYALLRDLRGQGMRPALAAAFLGARAVKPPLLPLLVHYFGLAYAALLSAYLLLAAVAAGWLVERVEAAGSWDDAGE
jgi:uncharacterized membrane protein YraQ (UPF0718 family)